MLGMLLALLIGLAALVAGVVLIIDDQILLAILIMLAGGFAAGAVILVSEGIALARSVRDWVKLVRGKPDSVRVTSVAPPKGFLLRRDAIVTLEVEAQDGQTKTMEQSMRVPILQAILWRVAGRVPTPIGRLTDERKLNAKVWGRRHGKDRDAAPAQPSSE